MTALDLQIARLCEAITTLEEIGQDEMAEAVGTWLEAKLEERDGRRMSEAMNASSEAA